MIVEFFGVRGSVPSPGPSTAAIGGNTSCVSVRTARSLVILDAGTGIRKLGQKMLQDASPQLTASLLLSHYHWDHVQGLPFFGPLYHPSCALQIVGGPNGVLPLGDALRAQMAHPVFPVAFDEVPASVTFREVKPNTPFVVGDLHIQCIRLNHPGGVLGYRIQHGLHSAVYATDTEHYACVDRKLVDFARGADVLIYDAMYTPDEYAGLSGPSRLGWGHSTYAVGSEIAREAGVSQLVLYHHDPERSDEEVCKIERDAQAVFPNTLAAREGVTLQFGALAHAA